MVKNTLKIIFKYKKINLESILNLNFSFTYLIVQVGMKINFEISKLI